MPTVIIHGIGNHDPEDFRAFFTHVRDQLRASLERQQASAPHEGSFIPLFWGHWGPQAWYQGVSLRAQALRDEPQFDQLHLAAGVHAKGIGAAPFDAGLDGLRVVLSTPGPLHDVLHDLDIGADELIHAVEQTRGQPGRSTLVVKRLLVRAQLRGGAAARRIARRPEGRAALQALLALILDQPQVVAKGLPAAVSYPFWATVTALARHLRGSIMEVATHFVGDVMLYLARGAEVRDLLHRTIADACRAEPGEPLVLIGHSLGGVIAYEYAADLARAGRPAVDLLVTVGSQVALFAEYGLLHGAGAPPNGRAADWRTPILPGRWLNFYDPDDFLSFPIGGVFPGAAAGDRACSAGKPFPASHVAYWDNQQLYAAIAEAFPAERSAR